MCSQWRRGEMFTNAAGRDGPSPLRARPTAAIAAMTSLGSCVMDHVAAPKHAVKGTGTHFLVQTRGMLLGVDDAIVGPRR